MLNKCETNNFDNFYYDDNDDITIAMKFIDELENVTKYVIEQCNEKTKNQFKYFISEINVFCLHKTYDDICKKYKNPFSKKKNINFKKNTNDKIWNIVSGSDVDYDIIYSTYDEYYKSLYNIKENESELNKIITTNNYIQEKINNIHTLIN
jgi:hypothetical protein